MEMPDILVDNPFSNDSHLRLHIENWRKERCWYCGEAKCTRLVLARNDEHAEGRSIKAVCKTHEQDDDVLLISVSMKPGPHYDWHNGVPTKKGVC